MSRPRRNSEGGYALLIVLLIGAVMAIMLAISLPRAAFEAQRDKEDDLMYRGGQYARAVRLYFRKNKRYPASMDDLEKSNNIRYLRKKYVDPITKKDEWRIIHIGPAGTFTDSLVYDQPKKKDKDGESSTAQGPALPGMPTTDAQQITGMADRLRANAGGQPNPNDPNAPPGAVVGAPGIPGQPGAPGSQVTYFNPGYPGATPGVPGQPGQPNQPAPGIYPVQGNPGNPYQQNPYPGSSQPIPGTPGAPGFSIGGGMGQPQGGIPGGRPGTVVGGMFGGQTTGFGGPQPNQPMGASGIGSPQMGSAAANIINQLLTTPRPGGLAGLPPGPAGSTFSMAAGAGAMGGQSTFGGGIAGVASKSEARGIKVYNEREIYKEWEFVYDFRRDPLLMGGAAGGVMPGQLPGQQVPGQGMIPGQQGPGGAGGLFGPSAFGPGQTGAQPGGFGQPAQTPATPINPMQPGLPSSPFGQPRR